MDAQDAVTALQLLSSVGVLSYASLLDWRTRRVGNAVWIVLSALAVLLLVARVLADDAPLEYLLITVPVLAVFADVYFAPDGHDGLAKYVPVALYAIAILSIAYLAYLWMDDEYFTHLLTIPIMMVLVVVMYMLDLIRGGADAKALMALSVMFPFYPDIGPFPLISAENPSAEVLFPFTFIVLVTAAIIVAFMPISFALKNLAAGEFAFPLGLAGYKLDASEAKTRQVWLMERMDGDVHKTRARPRADEDLAAEVDALVSAGHGRVWVTPKVPFIIPITIALAFTTVVGNILALVMNL